MIYLVLINLSKMRYAQRRPWHTSGRALQVAQCNRPSSVGRLYSDMSVSYSLGAARRRAAHPAYYPPSGGWAWHARGETPPTAMHPLTGVCLSPIPACAPWLENPATPVLSTPNEVLTARTDRAHRARASQHHGVSPSKPDASERVHPVHTSALPPLPAREACDDQGHQRPCAETVHGPKLR
jgi:hypothetical protein